MMIIGSLSQFEKEKPGLVAGLFFFKFAHLSPEWSLQTGG
jgi:hypothetical protein